jgi:hypothetical protein
MPAAQTILIDGSIAETFVILMGTSIETILTRAIAPGQMYVFILRQDAVGGHTIAWGNLRNGTTPNADPHASSTQSFIADQNGILKVLIPGT